MSAPSLEFAPLTQAEVNARVAHLSSQIAWRVANVMEVDGIFQTYDLEYLRYLSAEMSAYQDAPLR